MFRNVFTAVLLIAFAGHALALNIVTGTSIGNLTASQLLAVPEGPWLTQCTTTCTPVNATVQGCDDSNDACLCTAEVAEQLTECEQCMFNVLVAMNMKMPDPRVGSNPALAAYTAACTASQNVTLKAALVIAPNWDGPTDIVLDTPATVVVVGFGAFLGISALLMFGNLS